MAWYFDYQFIYMYCKYKRDILRRYKIIFCVTLDYTTTFVLPIIILTYYIGSLLNTDDKSLSWYYLYRWSNIWL